MFTKRLILTYLRENGESDVAMVKDSITLLDPNAGVEFAVSNLMLEGYLVHNSTTDTISISETGESLLCAAEQMEKIAGN